MSVPFFLGLPLVMLLILGLIGLFIFFIVRFGKDRPAVAGWIVGGFVLLFVGGVFFFRLTRQDGPKVISWLLPLVLVGPLVAVVIAFVKGGRAVRTIIGVLAVLALLVLPVLGLFFARAHVARDVAWEEPATEMVEPAIWHEGVVDQYAADVYPSRRSAARALGMRVSAALDEVLPGRREVTRIRFVPDDANPCLVDVLAEGYGARGGTWTVASAASSSGDDEVTVDLKAVDVKSVGAPWSAGQADQLDSGTLQAGIHLKDGTSTTVSAEFVDKPWVENIAAFLGRDPKRQFALGRSNRSCTSPQEACGQAMSAACEAVANILRQTQAQPMVKVNMTVGETDLNSAGLVVDRFTQRLSGAMAGPIWREAVLVDVSDEKMQQLAGRKIAASRRDRTTWAKMALTLAGMFALISAVYVFLNAATRGYYTWALRVAVVVLMGAGVFFLLLLA